MHPDTIKLYGIILQKKYLGLEYFNVYSDCVEQQKLW